LSSSNKFLNNIHENIEYLSEEKLTDIDTKLNNIDSRIDPNVEITPSSIASNIRAITFKNKNLLDTNNYVTIPLSFPFHLYLGAKSTLELNDMQNAGSLKAGAIVYNTDTNKLQYYEKSTADVQFTNNGVWRQILVFPHGHVLTFDEIAALGTNIPEGCVTILYEIGDVVWFHDDHWRSFNNTTNQWEVINISLPDFQEEDNPT
jgi:hypothetical protein